jgi:putative hydrolase of the HAD superfamily
LPIRVIFFDMGDTLTTILPSWEALYVRVCAARGIVLEESAVAAASRAVFGALDTDESRMTYENTEAADQRYYQEINGAILRRAGAPMNDELVRILETLQHEFETPAHFHVFPDAIPTLEALRAAGYRLGIISNWSWNLPDLCDGMGISRYFEHITTSARVGASKPHRAIYDYALNWFGVRPEEAVQIGDNATADVAGARAVGMHGILIDRRDRPAPEGVTVVRALAEVPALVAALSPPLLPESRER